ncbi:cobyrinic acid ac-diamide synthase [Janthinobacterium fluminis]|uniref:Cobyrinic acid ac-diamide synthase n=1 Tax=Janthinobacterium fluminis TaxID=2987524 RepID=A0ABT5K1Y9_9BURK|nr:cobyrinic acid ac-diamide synthase [Janthinobacterium fluminis]MDC8758685.1 cobyrinic acid ac-diamide synthase [Janthinobacterium fluminis]
MIITVTDASGGAGKSVLAGRLAAARALAGRKVLLLDADPRRGALACCAARPRLVARAISAKGLQPELEHLVNCYHDIVIDSEGRDSMGSRAALIAARVVIVPFDAQHGDAAARELLVRRIGKARMFNPGLRVLLVCEPAERARADVFAAQIPAASVTDIEGLYGAVFQ